jgi:hypothetical protein
MRKKLKKYQSNKETGEIKRDATRVDASATKAETKRAVVERSKAQPTPIAPLPAPKIERKKGGAVSKIKPIMKKGSTMKSKPSKKK